MSSTASQQMAMWTDAEVELVREHYPLVGRGGCQALLPHRTLKAIETRAAILGVTGPRSRRRQPKKAAPVEQAPLAPANVIVLDDVASARRAFAEADKLYQAAALLRARAWKTYARLLSAGSRDVNHQRRVS